MEIRKVLIAGAEENPSLPIIESISKKGIDVCVASHKKICVGFFSRYVKKRFVYPSPFTNPDGFVNELVNFIKREGFDVTFVTGEQPTLLLSKYKNLFEQYTKLPLVDFGIYMKCRDKSVTMKIASRIGVPTPKTYYPEEEDIRKIVKKVDYPVVVKPNSSNGARGIVYPGSPEELLEAYDQIKYEYGPCHIQEYIPHAGMQYKAELLLDGSNEVKAGCVYNKLRYYPPSGGSSTINCTVDRRDILEYAARILKEIGWYGMGDCDFIEDPRDGVPKLMEINPRFTRSIKICVLAGVDFPYLLYRLAMGKEVPCILEYKIGMYLRYLPSDIVWFFKSSNRLRTRPNFFWFLGKDLRYEIISLRDPGPAVAYFLSMALSLLDKNERKFRLR